MRVIAQHNLWFRGKPRFTNYKLQGRSMISVAPLLGRRDSSDARALDQEMQWLHRYSGRDGRHFVYSLEWIRPGDLIDRNLNAVFLPAVERTRAQWNIFYDPVLAVRQRDIPTEHPIDFSRGVISRMFNSDLAYFWDNYFGHPNYWRLFDKPVLYIWSANTSLRNAEALFEQARGQGIYLLGDVFGGSLPAPPLDGYTGFVASTPELAGRFTDIPSVMPFFDEYYAQYSGSEVESGDLIPALSAQYDDSDFQSILRGRQTRILANDQGDVNRFLRRARRAARGIDGERYVFFGTTNNWAEGSTILPTRLKGAPFLDTSTSLVRIGDYGFAHLEAMHDALFVGNVPRYEGPQIFRRPNGNVVFRDCDVLGKLKFRGRAANPPDWATGENLGPMEAGERLWKPREAAAVTLRFENLDGRKVKTRIAS